MAHGQADNNTLNLIRCEMAYSLRSALVEIKIGEEVYTEVEEWAGDFGGAKLPRGSHVMGRLVYLQKDAKKSRQSIEESSLIVAKELMDFWIFIGNIYPKTLKNIAKNIKTDYTQLKKLEFYPQKHSKKYLEDVNTFNEKMSKAYNVRSTDKDYEKKMAKKHGIKITTEEEQYFENNCFGDWTAKSSRVDQKWLKNKRRVEFTKNREEQKVLQTQQDNETQKQINKSELEESLIDTDSEEINNASVSSGQNKYNTRHNKLCPADDKPFPQIPIRTSLNKFNETIICCIVQISADYNIPPSTASKILCEIGNNVFNQVWETTAVTEPETDTYIDSDEECEYSTSECKNYLNTMPSRRTLNRYIEDAAILNLKYVGDSIINKNTEATCTMGVDDVKKAAGHRIHDAKSTHITIKETGKARKTLTTGFHANKNHTGKASAEQITNVLKMLSILSESTLDEVKQSIDFWMVDRAGDAQVMLENLNITEDKQLKCNAHIILCVDNAIEKVFIATETKIGVHKLLDISAGTKKFSGSSVFTLSQIALAKLLSPSHAEQSISNYTQFQNWCSNHGLSVGGFHGFVANRFGWIAENTKVFLQMHEVICQYFSEVVDETSNKLLTAVAHYITNDWVKICADIYIFVSEIIIFPLMALLGIDRKTDSVDGSSTWADVYNFFNQRLKDISKLELEYSNAKDGKDQLIYEVLKEVNESLKRQLSEVKVFQPILEKSVSKRKTKLNQNALESMRNAPLTNSGCESENAHLGLMCSQTGGNASLQTLSNKRVISKNGYLKSPQFKNARHEDRLSQWKWSRTSTASKQVKGIEQQIIHDVKVTKDLAVEAKKQNKIKKRRKLLNILDKVKEHDGPVAPSTVDSLLPSLTTSQLIHEITYIRHTINPDIRQKQRVKQADGKYKMVTFSNDILRSNIKNSIKPETDMTENVEQLLKSIFTCDT